VALVTNVTERFPDVHTIPHSEPITEANHRAYTNDFSGADVKWVSTTISLSTNTTVHFPDGTRQVRESREVVSDAEVEHRKRGAAWAALRTNRLVIPTLHLHTNLPAVITNITVTFP
jgi:hypothetical protein